MNVVVCPSCDGHGTAYFTHTVEYVNENGELVSLEAYGYETCPVCNGTGVEA